MESTKLYHSDGRLNFPIYKVLLIPFNKLPCLFTSLGCEANCAPTFDMLSTSQAPSTALFLNFGAGQETADARPESSLCVAN